MERNSSFIRSELFTIANKHAVGKASGNRETVPRNTAENTIHHGDSGGLVVANNHSGSRISVTVTRLEDATTTPGISVTC